MALEDARTAFGGRIEGAFAPDFEPVARTFAENFATYGELGASACIELGDVRVLDLWGGHAVRDGPAWERDTIHFRGITWFLLMDLIAWPGLVLILPAAFGRI